MAQNQYTKRSRNADEVDWIGYKLGPWEAVAYDDMSWGMVNTLTGHRIKVGPVTGRGKNWLTEARRRCANRNRTAYRERALSEVARLVKFGFADAGFETVRAALDGDTGGMTGDRLHEILKVLVTAQVVGEEDEL